MSARGRLAPTPAISASPDNRTLPEWLAHIQSLHWRSIDMQLGRIARVWENLAGRRSALVISVAGTNGKGSCVAMLEAALRETGLKTGSYTSPHLVRYNERVRVDGRAADDATLCAAFADIERARDGIRLTYFEFGTLCALLIFQRRRVDVSILEVGMGGRLDAVNLIDNDIALITSIGIDHAQWLGRDRARIAAEKAGILKPNALAVCAEPRPPACIARIAAEQHCELLQNGVDYQIEQRDDGLLWQSRHPAVASAWRRIARLQSPLSGAQQLNNLGGVVAVLALARARIGGGIVLSEKNLRDGLANTRLQARCQVIAGDDNSPEVILDVAHNPDSAAGLADFLAWHTHGATGTTHGVFAALADKPAAAIVKTLDGAIDRWYLATLAGERGQTADALKAQLTATAATATATTHDSPLAAYLSAIAAAAAHDRVVVFGSFYTVGDIITHFQHPC